ncbi:17948_t:CDS:2 [Acaulospora morrowiae]|uniref:17948_t:CDS:1 n=1 Tax=Acaulospora morrowiae TaxID=94023 RepID=A0A9N9AHX3_9GLOM|nr:17948_t:CDS:2 [Acaulospora morrowiae]
MKNPSNKDLLYRGVNGSRKSRLGQDFADLTRETLVHHTIRNFVINGIASGLMNICVFSFQKKTMEFKQNKGTAEDPEYNFIYLLAQHAANATDGTTNHRVIHVRILSIIQLIPYKEKEA